MQYALTIYEDQSGWGDLPPDQPRATSEAYGKLTEDMRAAGVFRAGEGLQPAATATTVRVPNGERLVTDGPFAETKEQLGGFYVLECKDLDEALDWAAKIPATESGCVEVRPVIQYD